ncbi:MAG: hypothetical protein AB7S99_01285 [Pseudodonghicola sp.]
MLKHPFDKSERPSRHAMVGLERVLDGGEKATGPIFQTVAPRAGDGAETHAQTGR